MKKYIPYSIGIAALVLLFILVIVSPAEKNYVFDERISLQQKDKIPYGTFVTYHLLPSLFPTAAVTFSKKEPVPWHPHVEKDSNMALFLMAKTFDPGEYDLERITAFAKRGNHVFIIAKNLSFDVSTLLHVDDKQKNFSLTGGDSLVLMLNKPPYSRQDKFVYPGKQYDAFFSLLDTLHTIQVLGKDNFGAPNFIQLRMGDGKFYVHLAPLAFSNYFLLHKQNVSYLEKAVAWIPKSVRKVYWNEYYLTKRKPEKEANTNAFGVLLKYPSFRAALLSALIFLAMYVLMEMRRKQRVIPLITKPSNDSLHFVKTMGRLYYDGKDHKNLSKKMAAYFIDYIRMNYKMQSFALNNDFVQELHKKTSFPLQELNSLVYSIKYVNEAPAITEEELARFYKQLENFYQNS